MNEMQTYSNTEVVSAKSVNTEMMISRQAQEVQAAMVVAKRFPRDEIEANNRILNACKRKSLAERAIYEYPRGGENVTGPSIRLAEVMAQNWGNLDFGITELEQKNGESTVMAYCWDLETNTRQTKIPGDVVDAALAACTKTMMGKSDEPMIDRVRKMGQAFKDDFGVPMECLEKYIGCKAEAFTAQSIVRLRNVYTSLKEGRASREQYFDLPTVEVDETTGEVKGELPAPTDVLGTPDDGKTGTPKQVSMDDL